MDNNENPNLECMLALMKSTDPVVSDEASTTLKNIINNGDNDILKNCFEQYVKTGCKVILDVLISVKAPMDKILLEYILSILQMYPFAVLDFLFLTVKKSPTWIHHLTENAFFQKLTEFVEQSNNVAFVIGILYVLSSLLPQLPSLSSELDILFRLLIAAAKLLYDHDTGYKRALRKALVIYCQNLYTLYPCSFIGYMRSEFASQPPNSSQLSFFATIIRPIFKAITVHPLIITSTKDAEISKDRWLNKEPNDCFIESLDVSVDQTDDCMLECIPTEVTTVPNVYYANWQGAVSNFNSEASSSDVVELHRRGSGGNLASFMSKYWPIRNPRSDSQDAKSVDGRMGAEKNELRPRLRCQTTPRSEHELLVSKRERALNESRKVLNLTPTTAGKDSSTDSPPPVTPTYGSVGSCNEDPGATSKFSSAASHQPLKQRRSFGSAIAKLFRLSQHTGSSSKTPSLVPLSPSKKGFGFGESVFPNMIRLVERDSDTRTLLKQAEAQPTEIAKEANEEDSPPNAEQLRTVAAQLIKEPQTADAKHCSSISSSTGQVFSGKSSSFLGPPPQMRNITSAGQQQQQQQWKLTKQISSAVLCSNSATVGTTGLSVTATSLLTKAEQAKHEDNKAQKKMPILLLRRFSSCPNLTFITGDNNKPTFTNTVVNTMLPASPSIFPAFSSSPIQQQQYGDIRPEVEINGNSVDEIYINLGEELYSEMKGRLTNLYNIPTDTVQARRHSNDNEDEKPIQLDNASIWKMKIHLLEYELEFERYKRDQHAERNQRLNDRLKHLIALEQYLQSNLIQIRWLFHQRSVLNERVAKLKSENLRIQNTFSEKERTWLKRYAQLNRENQQLKQNVQSVEQTVDSIEGETIKVFQKLEVVSKELTEKQMKMEAWEKNVQSCGIREQGLQLTVRTLQDQLAAITEQCREYETKKVDLVMTEKQLAEVEALIEQQAEKIDRLKSTSWTRCHKQRIAMHQPRMLRLQLAAKEKLIAKLKALTERENSEIQALHHMHAQLQAVCCEKDWHLVDFYKQMNTANVDDSSGQTADTSTAQTGDPSSLTTTRTEANTSSADSTDHFRSSA
ncbi:Hamartin [Trichinella nativa]|uniref:Hamartin n=1 Tax=Trichinella nativa TaxID=6335 RepID=A0A0V1L9C2_9BILA|nr:Hamartin [Trichinella nativa]